MRTVFPGKKKIAALILSGVLPALLFSGCAGSEDAVSPAVEGSGLVTGAADGQEYTKTLFAMDTYMTLTAYGEKAEEAVEAGAEEIKRLDALFSIGDEGSEIYAVNAAGGGALSEEAAMLVRRSLNIWEQTDGLFDISVYPIMKLWGFPTGEYRVPEAEEIAETLPLVNAGNLLLTEKDEETILSMEDGMQIDLGGIVKGYADDRVAEIFSSYGITDAVINLGGDVRVMGTRPDGTRWRVGIRDPEDEDGYLGGLALTDISVVTSGGYERYFEDTETGIRYHHIIDPRTGAPADNGLLSVSVISEDGTLADALSTTLFILGTEDAVTYCEAHCAEDGFGALLMTEDREIYLTEDLEESFIDLAGDTKLHLIETNADAGTR